MVSSFLLALGEGIETALIIGIVLGTLRKLKYTHFSDNVWFGVGTAPLVSAAVALILNTVGASFTGKAEGIFEGFTMLLAAGVLTWMIFWMRAQANTMQMELESNVK